LRTEIRKPRLTGKSLADVRLEMLEHGFSLVDAPLVVDDRLLLQLKRRRTVMAFHARRWLKFPQLARYACWLEWLLGETLPEEAVSLAELDFRHEDAGSADEVVDKLHVDGSYIRTVVTLYGPTTIYRAVNTHLSAPSGQTLLMTAVNRARALGVPSTLHRRPGPGPERAVIVCSFEPRQDQAENANVYRQAAQIRKRRSRAGKPGEHEEEREAFSFMPRCTPR
jgi:hypothetical protein